MYRVVDDLHDTPHDSEITLLQLNCDEETVRDQKVREKQLNFTPFAFQLHFICNTLNTPRPSRRLRRKVVAGQSPMISLRIPEDYLLELERRVGFDGMRTSLMLFEKLSEIPGNTYFSSGTRIEVELGPDLSVRLDDFCRIHGEHQMSS